MLHLLDFLPEGFLDARARDLFRILPGPTLLELAGRRPEPLFVSVMLHGNEDVGLRAIQKVFRTLPPERLPRALSVFIGNVDAARDNVRYLPGQPDFNRVWPGTTERDRPEARMMAQVVERLRSQSVFASIDLHNNTGHNPHYACVTHLDHPHLQLARLFGPTAVYFRRPTGVQTRAFGDVCPSVTCECGMVGDESGADHAAEFVSSCLHLSHFPERPVPAGDLHLFHTVATVRVPDTLEFDFEPRDAPVVFAAGLDRLNFAEVPAGTILARRRDLSAPLLTVEDEEGRDVTSDFLDQSGETVRTRRVVVPSMFTRHREVIRQDCLGYLMERLPYGSQT